jgi:hypothetical protein
MRVNRRAGRITVVELDGRAGKWTIRNDQKIIKNSQIVISFSGARAAITIAERKGDISHARTRTFAILERSGFCHIRPLCPTRGAALADSV